MFRPAPTAAARTAAALLCALALALAGARPAAAGSLAEPAPGVRAFTLEIAAGSGSESRAARAALDVAITGHHGFQGDLALESGAGGTIGRAGAHLYLAPAEGRKYGLFALAGDADGRSAAWGALGAEAMLALGPGAAAAAELSAGLALARPGSHEALFAQAALHAAPAPGVGLTAALALAEYDEPGLSAMGYEARLGLRLAPGGGPWGLTAGIAREGLSGAAGQAPRTTLRLGLSLALGAGSPAARPFAPADPIRPLVRRGLF